MATKEIIEVDSSDEEAEPPPKKRKPVPNAMVHIPSRLPGISIKPAKKSTSNSSENIPTKTFLDKNITPKVTIPIVTPKVTISNVTPKVTVPNVTPKSNVLINPLVNKLKSNAVTVKKAGNTVVYLKDPLIAKQHPVKKTSRVVINSPNLNRNLSNIQLKKVQPQGPKRAGSSVLSNLPSSITIKKALSSKSVNLPTMSVVTQKKDKNMSKPIPPVNEIPTVDLDDDEVAEQQPPTSNPQWYMRPEDSQKVDQNIEDDNSEDVNFEEQNNKEPETPKYVEIIIEDSPIKPAERHFNQIGKELPVIIEDSPCKNKSDGKQKLNLGKEKADPHSRKKLNYPNEQQSVRQIVEIEIDPIDTTNILPENKDNNIIEDHPKDQHQNKTRETCATKMENVCQNNKEELEQEFNPTYQKFIETCFEIENSDDMKKIVEKKIKAYYRQCPKEYVESEEFIDMVSSKTESIKAGPDKMYLYIKDIVDELNMQRKLAKSLEAKKEVIPKVPEESLATKEEDGECDTKRLRQIRKLEKTIKQLHRAIQKLEEQEVDLDDEENSMYLLTERYKERLVRVHAKFRQMTNTKMPSEPRIVIEARPGCPQGPAKKLEKFINKKVPIGAPLPFPDFHDVLRCVREANEEDGLRWSNMEIEAEARDLFERCGKKLKRRRQENEWRISVASRIPTDTQDKDPAEDNVELKQKLCENKLIAAKRESEVLNKYADRQHQLKLEAEEIGDKEVEESDGESDEEEVADSHLADKEKRKEILKRLIKEKNRRSLRKNDASPDNAANGSQNSNTAAQSNDVNVACANENNLESETQKNQLEPMDVHNDNLNSNDDKETESNVIDIDSDVDELHLLQKLRFEDEVIASSSDSDSTIAISDSLESESDGENNKIVCTDIISIENSSYSESEALPEEVDGLSNVAKEISSNNAQAAAAENLESATLAGSKSSNKTNDEDSVENIFLASSEEDATSEKDVTLGESETCKNLNDDVLSLTDTVIEGENIDQNKDVDKMGEVTEVDGLSNVAIEKSSNDVQAAAVRNLENATLAGSKSSYKTNDENSIENIFLASSEEDATSEKDVTLGESERCKNLNDDVLSLTDTVIEGENIDQNKDVDKMGEVKESELRVIDDKITEETQSTNGDCIEPKDMREQVTLNDNDAVRIEFDTNSEKEGNTVNVKISDGQEKI